MTTTNSKRKVLITGASGKLGREAVEALLGRSDLHVIAASRTTAKLADLQAKGAELRAVDFDDAASLKSAFAGVERVLIVSTDALDRPGRRLEQHVRAIDAAIAAGVKHVVYTSLTRAEPGSTCLIAPDHIGTEQHLLKSGIGHTVLRNALYADNFLGTLPGAVKSGQLYSATQGGKAAYVTRSDCAQTAAAALASTFDGKRTLEVGGPELLTLTQVASLTASAVGKPITHIEVPLEGLKKGMTDHGLPGPIADVYASFDLAQSRGEYEVPTKVVQELTGRPATTFASWAQAHRAALLG